MVWIFEYVNMNIHNLKSRILSEYDLFKDPH